MPIIKRTTPTVSFRKMLQMTPGELSKVHPDNFKSLTATQIGEFSEAQLFAFTPEQIKVLKPISFCEVAPEVLQRFLAHLEETIPEEEFDVEERIEVNFQGKEVKRKYFGAKETIRRAIPKAKKFIEDQRKKEALRNSDGMITDEHILADVVAAKLDISVRYLYILSEDRVDEKTGEIIPAEIVMQKESNKLVCLKQSVLDYLNRQRVAGAQLDEEGNPILQPEEYEKPMNKRNEKNYVPVELEPLTEIPILYPVKHFADRLKMDARSFIRNCNLGMYDHFRIGTVLKMSEEDFVRSVQRRTKVALQNRAGRPTKIDQLISNDQ